MHKFWYHRWIYHPNMTATGCGTGINQATLPPRGQLQNGKYYSSKLQQESQTIQLQFSEVMNTKVKLIIMLFWFNFTHDLKITKSIYLFFPLPEVPPKCSVGICVPTWSWELRCHLAMNTVIWNVGYHLSAGKARSQCLCMMLSDMK